MGDSAIHAVAGAVGGSVAMALTYPLANLSTRAAVSTKKGENLSIRGAIVKTLKTEGVSGLYSGLSSSLIGIAITNGVFYQAYEETRSVLIRRRPKTPTSASSAGLSTGEGIIAGVIAGSITTILTSPVWTIQAYQSTRAVANDAGEKGNTKPGAIQSAKEIIKKDGVKGLWRGLGPALVLVINPVVQYTTFERLVTILLSYRQARSGTTATKPVGRSALSDWDLFLLGAVSKLIATGGTYPILVVKSRLQAATHKYGNIIKAIIQILKTEGISGLYAGLGPKLLQSALTAAFMFVAQRRIYELVKGFVVAAQQAKLKRA